MFESWSPWSWVMVAWAELVVAYGGYLAYLGWRARRVRRGEGER